MPNVKAPIAPTVSAYVASGDGTRSISSSGNVWDRGTNDGIKNVQGLVGRNGEHNRVHGMFHGVDDICRDRHSDQAKPGSKRNAVRYSGGATGFNRLADPPAAGHVDRPVRRPHGVFHTHAVNGIPIWLISRATEFWHFLVTGLFVGIAGGSFTVGIAYCARWFPRERQGLAMGIFGAGNTGAAVNKLVASAIVVAYGWAMVPQVYAVLMLVTAVLFWLFTYTDEKHATGAFQVTVKEQLVV